MITLGEIGGGNLLGCERHRGAKVGAHGALAVRRHKGEALAVGLLANFEAGTIATELNELLLVKFACWAVAYFAEEAGVVAHACEREQSVTRGAAGRFSWGIGEGAQQSLDGRGIDEHHPSFIAIDLFDEVVLDLCDCIDDGAADTDDSKW